MKKALWFLLIILFLFFESCSDDFNINDPNHQEIYVLNCILRNDNSIQYAIISKNEFTESGTPPASNSTYQNIKDLNIKIFYNDSVFVMRDTTIQLTDSGNITRVSCYYAKNLIMKPGKIIRIEASVPDGKKLESTIQVPAISYGSFSSNFPQVFQSGYQVRPYYSWRWTGSTEDITSILNLPQLEIYYQKYEGGTYVDKKIFVPLAIYYIYDENGNPIPVKVELSFFNYCVTTLETVNKTMQEISGDDPNKKNYIINKVLFSVISLDPELSRFYSAYNTYAEDFTIKLRQTDYSNIEGGQGIFGAYYKFSKPLVVDSLYISSFGYHYDP
jgi:hypothetical protein